MKLILNAAMLAVSALTSLGATQISSQPVQASCAERLRGKHLLGLGTVRVAVAEVGTNGRYLVEIVPPSGSLNPGAVTMVLTESQLCDFADSIETTTPGQP